MRIEDYQALIAAVAADSIAWDIPNIGRLISHLIQGASDNTAISSDDIKLYCIEVPPEAEGQEMDVKVDEEGHTERLRVRLPASVEYAVIYGTPFFDALAYFSLPVENRPVPWLGVDGSARRKQIWLDCKLSLCWMALYIMLRGSWYEADTQESGRDIPAFLLNTFHMVGTPQEVRARLASFDIARVPCNWVRWIRWGGLSQKVRQRLGLSLAGYRQLSVLRFYDPMEEASDLLKINVEWVRAVLALPKDWALCSATRDEHLIGQMGSINHGVNQMLVEGYSEEQRAAMVACRAIYQAPVPDPSKTQWKLWYRISLDTFHDPVDFGWTHVEGDWEEQNAHNGEALQVQAIKLDWLAKLQAFEEAHQMPLLGQNAPVGDDDDDNAANLNM